ncbi:MAG: CPBP family intramembrane metalloprotease [Myxococcales bacterium]|nr:CPBP family intramembrane metalloprotease [Myxococcales bacterium]
MPSSPFRIGAALGLASGLGAVCVVPYLAVLLPELSEAPLPLWGVALVSGAQVTVIWTLVATLGVAAGRVNDLGAPWIDARLAGNPLAPPGLSTVLGAAAAGAVTAAVVAVLDAVWLLPRVTLIGEAPPVPGPLLGLVASLYGAVAEEVLVRLFMVSVLAWFLTRARMPRGTALALAVVVGAVAFGVLHLPAAGGVFAMSGWLVVRTVLLNGLLGTVFGALYCRHGLELAMVGHLAADIVLHVVVPAVYG